MSKQEKAEQQE